MKGVLHYYSKASILPIFIQIYTYKRPHTVLSTHHLLKMFYFGESAGFDNPDLGVLSLLSNRIYVGFTL